MGKLKHYNSANDDDAVRLGFPARSRDVLSCIGPVVHSVSCNMQTNARLSIEQASLWRDASCERETASTNDDPLQNA